MKKLLIIIFLILLNNVLNAQSIDEANQALYNEKYKSAENIYHAIIKQDPSNAFAWYGLTKSYLLQGKELQSVDSLKTPGMTSPDHPYTKIAAGIIAMQSGNMAAAEDLFHQAIKETKEKDAGVLAAVAEAHILLKNGNSNYAIELLNKAIKRDKRNAVLHVLMGDAYRNMHNGSEAYKAYKLALEKNSNYAPAHFKIGEIFLTQKNSELYLQHFNNAINSDPSYAPALYQLYVYEFFHNPSRAMEYYNRYVANADASLRNDYDLADLLYLNKQFDQAIEKANTIIASQGADAQPRLYKLLGYSYAEKKDSSQAMKFMEEYFAKAPDSIVIAKDFETMSALHQHSGNDSLAFVFLAKATGVEKDSAALFSYYKKLSNLSKQQKNYTEQAKWLALYYTNNEKANNVDLYNWGLANYLGGNYAQADSVFGLYVEKYPEQSFGYYWQAKSKALLDKDLVTGIAVPAYIKLTEVLNSNPSDPNYKKWMVESYGYLAAYEANNQKDYTEAVDYFEKVLEVDPQNEDAAKYIAILEKEAEK